MKKFFLFRKEEINPSSVSASDSGQGLSVLALPADSLAFASAGVGSVVLFFKESTKYEESNLTDGESLEKTSVTIPCERGGETSLIESILSFISREGGNSVMKFDAVDKDSTFSQVSFDTSIQPRVKINPTKRVTGEASTQTFIGSSGTVGIDVTSTSVGGIDFGATQNKPFIDFNHEGLSSITAGHQVNSWSNAGTGGSTYNIGSNVGSPTKRGGITSGKPAISKDYVEIAQADHFIVPAATISNDYTAYVVFSYSSGFNFTPIYGSADERTLAPFIGTYKDGSEAGKIAALNSSVRDKVSIRHKGRNGLPATSSTTVSLPSFGDASTGFEDSLNVLVIRRDASGNIFFYDKNGNDIADIDALTPTTAQKDTTVQTVNTLAVTSPSKVSSVTITDDTDFRTDGDLVVERLGTVGDFTTNSFDGNLARFGVISRDIGAASCSKLATDLFNLYKI